MVASSQFQDLHSSVMANEVLAYLAPKDGECYVDGTFGAGGHSHAILSAAECTVYGIDRDSSVEEYRKVIKDEFADRFHFLAGCFGDIEQLLKKNDIGQVDGVLLDIGVSSMQLDNGERGFSFQQEGPLDMRMSRDGESVADIVSRLSEEDLADVIYRYGDERDSRRIARNIVAKRKEVDITTTTQLAQIVSDSVRKKHGKIHPATKTFQALRIYVNDELRELERALEAAERVLKPGGRLVVITFHSGEDVILKQFLKEKSGKNKQGTYRHIPLIVEQEADDADVIFELLHKRTIQPTQEEVDRNPRARSAKLRAAKRTGTSTSSTFQVGEMS